MEYLIISLLIIALIVSVIIIYCLYNNGIIIFNRPSKKYKIKGIDVSSHQGNVDWEVLSKQNIKFAFIRSTDGKSYVDSKFKYNLENALKNNLKVGAYHFFRFSIDGKLQAENYIKNTPKIEGMFPPVIDVEFVLNNRYDKIKIEDVKNNIKEMAEVLKEYYGKTPLIYADLISYEKYILNDFKENKIWIRAINTVPKFKDGREWTFWQYSNKIKLPGYSGGDEKKIYTSVFYGDEDELNKL